MTDQSLARMEQILWPDGPRQKVWMIVDGARSIEVFRLLIECHLEYSCLYRSPAPDLEIVAPYLVELDYEYRDTRRLIRRAWGHNWGVFLKSETSLKNLTRHLREFLIVRDEKGRRLVFRYYDPRVLRVYLPTCNAAELQTVYGPIECFWTEAESANNILEFRMRSSVLELWNCQLEGRQAELISGDER